MLGNMNVFMAVLGIILFSGFLAAYFSQKWVMLPTY
ncbi:protein MgtS [Escherichia coli]|nr:protein MgtS [Escherichia coli]